MQQVHAAVNGTWDQVKQFGTTAKTSIVDPMASKIAEVWNKLKGIDISKDLIVPFHEHRIKHIDKNKLGICLVVAVVAAVVAAVAALSFATMPFAIVAGIICVASALLALETALKGKEQFHNKEACNELEKLRNHISQMPAQNGNYGPVVDLINTLKKPEFKHLEEDVKALEQKLANLIKSIGKPSYEANRKNLLSAIELLLGKLGRPVPKNQMELEEVTP